MELVLGHIDHFVGILGELLEALLDYMVDFFFVGQSQIVRNRQRMQRRRQITGWIDQEYGAVVLGKGLGDVAQEALDGGIFDEPQGVLEDVDIDGLVVADVPEGGDEQFGAGDYFAAGRMGVV